MDFWSVLRFIPHPLAWISNGSSAPRSTVATLSTPKASGLSSFPASCTLPLWVRIPPLQIFAAMHWTNPINVGMGIVTLCFQYGRYLSNSPILPRFGVPYISISLSLNVLLTVMIVTRLVLHGRNIRTATGSQVGISGLYKTISTMLIESCALFAVSSLVVVAALVRAGNMFRMDIYYPGSYVLNIFFPILAEIQVRAFPRPQSPG